MRATLKGMSLVVLLLAISLVAAACQNNGGGGGDTTGGDTTGGGSPADVARAWFNAAFAGDADTVRANTCTAGQDQAQTVADTYAGMTAALQGAEVDYSGLTYTTANESGDNATVEIGGNVRVTVAGQTTEQPMSGGDEPIEMPLVREGGVWKVCGF
jgi:hypothetical protein